ncbi:MAG: SIMPL domain-containing protein [Eubacteriales bacterium]
MNKNSKRLIIAAIVLLIAAIAVGVAGFCHMHSQKDGLSKSENGISVSAQGTITLKPDVAYISVGVQTVKADSQKAISENDAAMKKVYDTLKLLGIVNKDITTTDYNIWPQYDSNGLAITGYSVSNNVRIKVKNLNKLGEVLTAVGNAGANIIGDISFDVEDRTLSYNQALAQAMEKALARAEVIAKASGVKLGKISLITESSDYSGPVYAQSQAPNSSKVSGVVPVSGGQMDVTATVNVNYEIVRK